MTREELAAMTPLRGALHLLTTLRGVPTPEFLRMVVENVRSAMEQLLEPDPLLTQVEFAFLAIKQSTVLVQRDLNGRTITRVTIVDQDLYLWALAQVHMIGRGERSRAAAPHPTPPETH